MKMFRSKDLQSRPTQYIYSLKYITAAWDPRPTVLNWLKRTHREKGQTKAKSQPYFREVFAEAHETCNDIEHTDNDSLSFDITTARTVSQTTV